MYFITDPFWVQYVTADGQWFNVGPFYGQHQAALGVEAAKWSGAVDWLVVRRLDAFPRSVPYTNLSKYGGTERRDIDVSPGHPHYLDDLIG
jgi:hypothetical protein